MKPVLALVLGLAALLSGFAISAGGAHAAPSATQSRVAGLRPNPADRLFACPTRPDRIGRIIAPVMIDGRGPFRFVVDTGANHSMISARLAQALGLTPGKQHLMRVMGVTGAQELPWVSVARLTVGDLVMSDLRLPVTKTPVMQGADGILGVAMLVGDRIAVDFRHNEVWIGRSHGGGAWDYLDIPARLTRGHLLMIPARIGGIAVEAVIDTGSPRTLGNEALRKALMTAESRRTAPHVSIYGVTKEVSLGHLASSLTAKVGPITIRDLSIVYSRVPIFQVWHLESRPAVIIGMDVLGTVNALVLDFAYPNVYVLPVESPGIHVTRTLSMLSGAPRPRPRGGAGGRTWLAAARRSQRRLTLRHRRLQLPLAGRRLPV
ncbi:MAG TPA: retroviral-like aspartic protease family protein [Steroidobacteraceae bacterium]|nr:retroviral-like aspartic protease family protein [Steroidobacteraceae bacterium]